MSFPHSVLNRFTIDRTCLGAKFTMSTVDDISGEYKCLTAEEVERYKSAFKCIDKV